LLCTGGKEAQERRSNPFGLRSAAKQEGLRLVQSTLSLFRRNRLLRQGKQKRKEAELKSLEKMFNVKIPFNIYLKLRRQQGLQSRSCFASQITL
jgi:hypothetical protein